MDELHSAFMRYNAALLTLSAQTAAALDLTVSEMAACDHLHLDGPLTAGELGRRVGLSSGSVTALVDRLAARGFVERKPNPADRRSVLIHYVPQDRSVVGRQYAVLQRLGAALGELDGTDRAAVHAFLTRMAEAVMDAGDG